MIRVGRTYIHDEETGFWAAPLYDTIPAPPDSPLPPGLGNERGRPSMRQEALHSDAGAVVAFLLGIGFFCGCLFMAFIWWVS